MSDVAFATLTPSNALAKLAFSEVYQSLLSRPQVEPGQNAQAALCRMAVDADQVFDKDILRLRLETERRLARNSRDGESSESGTEPSTDTEESRQELGMIWVGKYLLSFGSEPSDFRRGWTMGKSPLENPAIDLVLCTKSYAKQHEIHLRNPHAGIYFDCQDRGLYMRGFSRSMLAQLTVNGQPANQCRRILNQDDMKIQADKLWYDFKWTGYAYTSSYKIARGEYVTQRLGGPRNPVIDMPTPLPTLRIIGDWTLGDPLGMGVHGKVFFGSNSQGTVAAVKLVDRLPHNDNAISEEISTFRQVTNLAEELDHDKRIARMVEVIHHTQQNRPSKLPFNQVAIILKPLVSGTLDALVEEARAEACTGRPFKGMTMKAASVFRTALEGVKVMHDAGWLHRDLKPGNIGILDHPPRAVLLDLGSSKQIPANGWLPSQPGTAGTINYLAPEFEFKETYGRSIDIWSMGVILYELTYGDHPWMFYNNPWRSDMVDESLTNAFRACHKDAFEKMYEDSRKARYLPTQGYIHCSTARGMLTKHRASGCPLP
ncbi:kinase-like domain-containing protein [Nemania sp. FL0031]|nr:kinase-like domain-containing protein [Nemania sp. FL0031]